MRRRPRQRSRLPLFGMADHDEMTGAQAWTDWQHDVDTRRTIVAALRQSSIRVELDSSFGGGPPAAAGASLLARRDVEAFRLRERGWMLRR